MKDNLGWHLCALGFSAALASGPVVAGQAFAARTVVVKPGDRAMSCDALASEINLLAQSEDQSGALPKKKRKGFGFLGRALSVASPMLGNIGSGTGALIASQAVGAAQAAQMEGQMNEQIEALTAEEPVLSTDQQRRERLMMIFEDKRC